MTKKELLESEVFQMLPEDGEIVFATGEKLSGCYAVNPLNISLVQECTNVDEYNNLPKNVRDGFKFEPKYKTCMVLDAIPYWLLKEKYGITLEK